MNSKDAYFLGFLALAYLYLDSVAGGPAPTLAAADPRTSDLPRIVPAPAATEPSCPRDSGHRISRRADGAIWCLGCDEGFYPSAPEWDWIMAEAAA